MFAQVIQGRTKDPDAIWARMEEWDRSIKPITKGFLGSTAGVSDDGEFMVIARFESEEVAQENSDRPEQGQWWGETEKLLDGEARFYDCTEVEMIHEGGSDDAGFVQVIQGRAKDKKRLKDGQVEAEAWLRENRPELIGGVRAWQGDDFSMFAYFESEEKARAGEQENPPEGSPAQEWPSLVEDIKFIDLRKPYFFSP